MPRALCLIGMAILACAGAGCRTAQDPCATIPSPSGATAGPAEAKAVVAHAACRANAEHKVVLIEFGASWCKWCTSFQNFVRSKEAGAIIEANYIVTNLVVLEADDKKGLENPGGDVMMSEWAGGARPGLPFYVFLDANGQKLADSNAMPDHSNVGFPYTPEEIQVFMGLLDTTAPRLSATDRSTVLAYLQSTGKK